jgi:hydrogenase maturation protein HypF
LRLAGGDQAIREVWRLALAALLDAYDGRPPLAELKLFQRQPQQTVANVRLLLGPEARAPRAHGLGRWFDAFGALVLGRPIAHFEGQVAIEWNLIADPVEAGVYPFELSDGEPMIVDPRPMVRAACAELLRGVAPARISARFHNTVGAATAALVERAAGRVGRMPVVLTGGCFQNARLAEGLLAELSEEFEVFAHGSVPPGDGGLALGQALIADAVLRSRAFSSAGGGGRPCPPAAAGGGGRPCPPGAGDGRLCSRVESRS